MMRKEMVFSGSRRGTRALLGLSCILLLWACGCSFRVAEKETLFRFDPDRDTLNMLVVYRGIFSSDQGEEAVSEIVDAIDRAVDGGRRFELTYWGSYDLDRKSLAADISSGSELEREALDWMGNISVRRVGLFFDEKKRLSGYQEIKIENVSQGIDLLNRGISAEILKSVESGDFLEDTEYFDLRSRDLILEFARRGDPWFRMVGEEIELQIPMTMVAFDRVRTWFAKEVVEEENIAGLRWVAQHFAYLRSFSVDGECVRFRLGPTSDHLYHLATYLEEDEAEEYNDSVLKGLELLEKFPDVGVTTEQLKTSFGWTPKKEEEEN